jgi:hypothetical protein
MSTISIDFVAGSHGHFLEYVANRYVAHQDITFSPFNALGASHMTSPGYIKNRVFECYHYTERARDYLDRTVQIRFNLTDLLPLSSVCLLRAGDSAIDIDCLETNTYNKLINSWFSSTLDEICHAYPDINLSVESPDCPRYVLREYFKFGFKNPIDHGLMKKLQKFPQDTEYFNFEFGSFYNTDRFVSEIQRLCHWLNTDLQDLSGLQSLHQEFLDRQIFRNHADVCNHLINNIRLRQDLPIPSLTVLQESYINAQLENIYHIEMPFVQQKYFNSTQEIIQYLDV